MLNRKSVLKAKTVLILKPNPGPLSLDFYPKP